MHCRCDPANETESLSLSSKGPCEEEQSSLLLEAHSKGELHAKLSSELAIHLGVKNLGG